ncbi:MAG: transglycosylase SLT domain-containing protein [Burkholderiaceae bacterium]|nr:transglycosylase SLT domain-containing protein [Burkholderiaceae bacterium]
MTGSLPTALRRLALRRLALRRRRQAAAALASAALLAAAPDVGAETAHELVETAMRHEEGNGVPRSLARAYELYCEAARAGSPEALMRIGWMYAQGRGRPRDASIAETLFRRAAGAESDLRDRLPDCLQPPYQIVAYDEPEPEPARLLARAPATATAALQLPDLLADYPALQRGKLAGTVVALAREHRLDPRLVLAVMRTESNFDPNARSPKNAQGLMQLLPETAERFAVRNAFDPVQNLRGGMRYLQWLLAYFRGDVTLALAGYNAGERAVDRHRGVPPYPETRDYVQRIRALYPHDRHPFDARVTEPPPWLPLHEAPRTAIRRASYPAD